MLSALLLNQIKRSDRQTTHVDYPEVLINDSSEEIKSESFESDPYNSQDEEGKCLKGHRKHKSRVDLKGGTHDYSDNVNQLRIRKAKFIHEKPLTEI